MLLKECDLQHILKYISLFDEQDKILEGVEGKTEQEIIEQYIESFPNVHCFTIEEDKGFIILEKDNLIGGFHIYLKKEFRTFSNGLDILATVIKKLKEMGSEKIYTLANGKNRTLLEFTKKFKEIGEHKGYSLYELI